jgi:hypothetical protein
LLGCKADDFRLTVARAFVPMSVILISSVLSGAKVLRKLGVDVGIVAVALEIAVWAEIDHSPY